ncbi:hypothetical protein D3C86_1428430 [compost metagenome]
MLGTILIGNFSETFRSDSTEWNRSQYIENWKSAAKKIATQSMPAAFCTSLEKNGATLWVANTKDNEVSIRQEIVPRRLLSVDQERINIKNSKNYEYENEDNFQVSEWKTDVKSIFEFLSKLKD